MIRNLSAVLAAGVLLVGGAQASLIGDSVTGCFATSAPCNSGNNQFAPTSATIIDPGVEFAAGGGNALLWQADFAASRLYILVTPSTSGLTSAPQGMTMSFSGVGLFGTPSAIVNVAVLTSYKDVWYDEFFGCDGSISCEQYFSQYFNDAQIPTTSVAFDANTINLSFGAFAGLSIFFDPRYASYVDFNGRFLVLDIQLERLPAPEPGTLALLGLGLAGLAASRRRKQ